MSDILYDLKSAAPLLTLAAISLGLVVACHPTEAPEPAVDQVNAPSPPKAGVVFRALGKTPQDGDAYIMTVTATGCEYLYVEMFQNGVSVTPNMARWPGSQLKSYHKGCRTSPNEVPR